MSIPFYSDIDLNNNKIINVANPVNNTDLANKIYVDTQISDLVSSIDAELETLRDDIDTAITTQISQLDTTLSNRITNEVDNLNQAILDNVIDRLNSTSTTNALSANQGFILNDRLRNLENIKNDYTSEPKVVGTFLSNDLYRYVIVKTFDEKPATQFIDIELTELGVNAWPINVYGFRYTGTSIDYFAKRVNSIDGVTIDIYMKQPNKLSLTIGDNVYNNWSNDNVFYIIVEYTELN